MTNWPLVFIMVFVAIMIPGIIVGLAYYWLTKSKRFVTLDIPEDTVPETPAERQTIIKEREVIKETIKIRCRNCGRLYDERDNKCPHCGGS